MALPASSLAWAALAVAGGVATGAVAAPAGADRPAGNGFYAERFENVPSAAALTGLGRSLFADPSLSASGRTACASCHDPAHAFGPPNGRAVQIAGADGRRPGLRAVPSLRYLQSLPPFTEHTVDDDGNDSIDQGPAGGHTWDGRSPSAHEQARIPLLSPYEMANAGPAEAVARVARSPEAAAFRRTFGARVFDDPARAFRGVLLALETYQQDPAEFYPYSSKYDAWLRREAALTPQEARGLAAFGDPARGNCVRCHPSGIRRGAFPAFTDFGYAALGVPRNAAIPANADGRYVDLGLCGPLRTDLAGQLRYCGLFRTPSLRNVATRRVFMHNGVFHRLQDVVRFYARRDTDPRGTPAFDDLPPEYRGNADRQPPFDRRPGDPPVLSDAEVADVVAFLRTLTDGYRP